ncbi:MAG: prepilin-type N-terminal cleavage/methylation domain-containing protein [Planctomycetota bacterium]
MTRHCPTNRRGFTFIEVMFAVLVMGAGVAMIAAMLPVAVRQTKDLREQAAGNAAIESGFHVLEAVVSEELAAGNDPLPDFGERILTYPSFDGAFGDIPAFDATIADRVLIEPDVNVDAAGFRLTAGRYGWIPFYQRGTGQDASIALVAVASRGEHALAKLDAVGPDYSTPATPAQHFANAPLAVGVVTREGSAVVNGEIVDDVPDRIAFFGRAGIPNEAIQQAAVEGGVVVIYGPTDDATTGTSPFRGNTAGGGTPIASVPEIRIYRLVERLFTTDAEAIPGYSDNPTDANYAVQFTLAPGQGLAFSLDGADLRREDVGPNPAADPAAAAAEGYLIGRRLREPYFPWDETDNPYVGPTQVVQTLNGVELDVTP